VCGEKGSVEKERRKRKKKDKEAEKGATALGKGCLKQSRVHSLKIQAFFMVRLAKKGLHDEIVLLSSRWSWVEPFLYKTKGRRQHMPDSMEMPEEFFAGQLSCVSSGTWEMYQSASNSRVSVPS
jgi:hypothetical protein